MNRRFLGLSGSLHPMMKSYDRVGLCALSVHSAHDNCGTSQVPCTHMMKPYDSLRLPALFAHTTHDGTSQAVCRPMMMKSYGSLRLSALFIARHDVSGGLQPHGEFLRQSQAVCAFCPRHSRKWRAVSGGLRHDENCRQSQALYARAHGKRGTPQAACMPILKLPTV